MTIRCEIVSQDRMVFEGDVDIVVVPGVAGEMGILPSHAPLLSTLDIGFIRVRQDDDGCHQDAGRLVDLKAGCERLPPATNCAET